jgi:single-strand selective monofunctional uracil DNA glycosylase
MASRARRSAARAAIRISRALACAVDRLEFGPPTTHVYDPLVYAREPHERFLSLAMRRGCEALFLGMNPGPFGMAQTGVPFGEVTIARQWLCIEGRVGRPAREHPRRPIEGFACTRSEVSGQRFWGWARKRFGTPQRFFARFALWNYCPLVFMEASGRNRTPDALPAREREPLFAACDRALGELVDELAARLVIGIGSFAGQRASASLAGRDVRIGTILHPSPANPAASRGSARAAERQLDALGVALAPARRSS